MLSGCIVGPYDSYFGMTGKTHAMKLMMNTPFTVGQNLHEKNVANGPLQGAIAAIYGVLPSTEMAITRVRGNIKNVTAIKLRNLEKS